MDSWTDIVLGSEANLNGSVDTTDCYCGADCCYHVLQSRMQKGLLSRDGFAAAMADLLRIVRKRAGVTPSANPCNLGSFHGMLPVNPSVNGEAGLTPHTCTLLRALAALPAIVERHGWHRPLALPAMVQLGFYPGGTGACYRPHLDR